MLSFEFFSGAKKVLHDFELDNNGELLASPPPLPQLPPPLPPPLPVPALALPSLPPRPLLMGDETWEYCLVSLFPRFSLGSA